MKISTHMKIKTFLLTLALGMISSMVASADSYASLAGSGDSITLREGETALVMAGAGTFTYAKQGKPCAFIRLSQDKKHTLKQTALHPIPLVGPCKITVRATDGYLGMRIVATGVRTAIPPKARVASVQPKVSTKRP